VRSSAFLKKSAQKTFALAGCGDTGAQSARNRRFLLRFFKKEALSFFA
jgi:hypothetical protein